LFGLAHLEILTDLKTALFRARDNAIVLSEPSPRMAWFAFRICLLGGFAANA